MDAIDERFEAVRREVLGKPRVRPAAGGSKPALSGGGNLVLSDLSGMVEYDPGEYTFTALAGTPLAQVESALAEHGQMLPFDPPLAAAGATLGGTVAAGLSGPGRFRFGGVRDFLLGIRFVDGRGRLLAGGGKVVKNAAGFDFPKLFVGSLGQYGVLLEVTFKVFPRPERWLTVRADLPSFEASLAALDRLARGSFEPTCLELEPPGRLWLRLGGRAEARQRRFERLQEALDALGAAEVGVLEGEAEAGHWQGERAFAWAPAGHGLVKIPLDPSRLPVFERALAELEQERGEAVLRRYGVGGNVAHLAWPPAFGTEPFAGLLAAQGLAALALRGSWPTPLLGSLPGGHFHRRLLEVLDPEGKFASGGNHAASHPA